MVGGAGCDMAQGSSSRFLSVNSPDIGSSGDEICAAPESPPPSASMLTHLISAEVAACKMMVVLVISAGVKFPLELRKPSSCASLEVQT